MLFRHTKVRYCNQHRIKYRWWPVLMSGLISKEHFVKNIIKSKISTRGSKLNYIEIIIFTSKMKL